MNFNLTPLLGVLFFSCIYLNVFAQKEPANVFLIVSIQAQTAKFDKVVARTVAPDFVSQDNRIRSDTFGLQSDHRFHIQLHLDYASTVSFKFTLQGKKSWYLLLDPMYGSLPGMILEPGDSVELYICDSGFKCIESNGRGAAKVNCLRDIYEAASKIDQSKLVLLHGSEWARLLYDDSVKHTVLPIVERYKPYLSPAVYNIILGEHIVGLLHSRTYALLFGREKVSDTVKLAYQRIMASAPIYLTLDSFLNYTTAAGYGRYLEMIYMSRYCNGRNRIFSTNRDSLTISERCSIARDSIKGILGEKVLYKYIEAILKNKSYDSLAEYDVLYYLNHKDGNDFYRTKISDIYQNTKKLKRGSDAYHFALEDTAGKIHWLKDFKGKVVVIDFVFYPCGGCFQLAPILEKMIEKYKNAQVCFISISIDANKSVWKTGIGKTSAPSSLQLYTDGLVQGHPIIKFYQIPSYPTLVLIDKAGKLISARAPDPRFDEGKQLSALIDEVLAGD